MKRLDAKGQAEVDKIQLETGASTINEIRAKYDRPAVENGDEPMASANLMTLKALIAKGETTELKPGNYTVPAPKPADKTNDGEGAEEGTEA